MYVAIDIGGTQMRSALIDESFNILTRNSTETGLNSRPLDLFSHVTNIIKSDLKKFTDLPVFGFGVSAPSVDKRSGKFVNPPNLPLWDGFSILEFIETEFSVPAYVGNDASLAALAEHKLGSGVGTKNMLYFTISTGVGGGIIINGDLYEGESGFAGELGHITVNATGEKCNCGNIGCLETYISGPSIVRQFLEKRDKGRESILRSDSIPTTAQIFEASSAGDILSKEVVGVAGGYLGVGIVSVMHTFEPERIVIGGGVSAGLNQLMPYISERVSRNAMAHFNGCIDIRRAIFSKDSSLIGAACYVELQK